MVARIALPCSELGSIARAFWASAVALGLLLSSSALRASSSWASTSLGSLTSAFLARSAALPSKFSEATNGEDVPVQRDFARHGYVVPYLAVRHGRNDADGES